MRGRGKNIAPATNLRRSDEGAAAIIFVAFMLPFLFFLFSLSMDLTMYFSEVEAAQKTIDQATVYASRFLPYPEAARTAARYYLEQKGALREAANLASKNTIVNASPDVVEISQNYQLKNIFFRYFKLEASTAVDIYSKARGVPFDVIIAVDRSSYMAPLRGEVWGDRGTWPPAQFFRFDAQLYENYQAVDPVWLTQQCFNPLLSTVKQIAISLYENFAAFGANKVGVLAYPGNGLAADYLRPVQNKSAPVITDGEAIFPDYNSRFSRDSFCAAAAAGETFWSAYRFPSPDGKETGLLVPGDPSGTVPIVDSDYRYNHQYDPDLRTREAIWSLSTHTDVSDFSAVLRRAEEVVAARKSTTERGGLGEQSMQSIFFLSGDAPWGGTYGRFEQAGDLVAQEISQIFSEYKNLINSNSGMAIKIYYVVPLFQFNSTERERRLKSFEIFLKEQEEMNGKRDPRFQLLLVKMPQGVAGVQSLVSNLILDRQTTMLSK